MKTKLLLFCSSLILIANQLSAQDAQFITTYSSTCPFYTQTKTYGDCSPEESFDGRVRFNYDTKEFVIFDMKNKTDYLNLKYKEEVNPDKIKGDENNLFLFDPKKNQEGLKSLKIYVLDDGSYKYILEFETQKVILTGVESDLDLDEIGDISQSNSAVYNQDNSTQGVKSIYFNNTTTYPVFVGVKLKDNWYHDWTITDWIKILPGTKVYIGEHVEDSFYYYGYCLDNDNKYILWDGKEEYNKVGIDGPYGFRKVPLTDGKMLDDKSWSMDIYITK